MLILYHISDSLILKIYLHNDTVPFTYIKQACLPQWPSFLQNILMVVMQQSRYLSFMTRILLSNLVFYSRVLLTPVSVLPLKPPFRVIEDILLNT